MYSQRLGLLVHARGFPDDITLLSSRFSFRHAGVWPSVLQSRCHEHKLSEDDPGSPQSSNGHDLLFTSNHCQRIHPVGLSGVPLLYGE